MGAWLWAGRNHGACSRPCCAVPRLSLLSLECSEFPIQQNDMLSSDKCKRDQKIKKSHWWSHVGWGKLIGRISVGISQFSFTILDLFCGCHVVGHVAISKSSLLKPSICIWHALPSLLFDYKAFCFCWANDIENRLFFDRWTPDLLTLSPPKLTRSCIHHLQKQTSCFVIFQIEFQLGESFSVDQNQRVWSSRSSEPNNMMQQVC